MFIFDWLHNFTPSRVALTLFGLPIYWYGLGYAVALALTFWLGKKLAGPEREKNWEEIWWWTAIFGLLGARLYFVLVLEPVYFWQNPLEIFAVWQGGLAIHGGIIGGILGIWYTVRRTQNTHPQPLPSREGNNQWPATKNSSPLPVRLWRKGEDRGGGDIKYWLDLATPLIALGQAIGRFGNYFNQELYGRPTTLPWGIPITGQSGYFHPTFLYESILNFLLAIVLWRAFRKNQQTGRPYGRVLALYLIGYGLIRFLMEFLRLDETVMLGPLRLPQVVAVIMIVIGYVILNLFQDPQQKELDPGSSPG